jgi:Zn-dependent protease with chaperone function
MLRAFLAQSILHALIAMLVIEGLLRAWRIEDAAWRLRLRVLPLALPIVALPLLFLLAPWRMSPWFAARWALFASERWNVLRVGATGLGDLTLLLAAGLGSWLFLRDAAPPILELVRRTPRASAGPWSSVPDTLEAHVWTLAKRLGIEPPAIRIVRLASPVLLCAGSRHPLLVVSTGTLARLDGAELEAALAHELAHAAYRDPTAGYLLMAARALTFFNPAAQWAARAVVDDIERRADQSSVRLGGAPRALASAMTTLFHAGDPPPVDRDASFERLFWRTRLAGVEARCHRLETMPSAAAPSWARERVALAAAGLLALAFFVV